MSAFPGSGFYPNDDCSEVPHTTTTIKADNPQFVANVGADGSGGSINLPDGTYSEIRVVCTRLNSIPGELLFGSFTYDNGVNSGVMDIPEGHQLILEGPIETDVPTGKVASVSCPAGVLLSVTAS